MITNDLLAFLFQLAPHPIRYQWVGADAQTALDKDHSLFIFSSAKNLIVGGGGTHFGLCIDDDLGRATSGTCFTFNNAPLGTDDRSKSNVIFNVRILEVWAFASP
jgi:hypothetical protein